MRFLVDGVAFLLGYVALSLPLTGGGVVSPTLLTRGDNPTFVVVACVLCGLLSVGVWRLLRWGLRASRRQR